MAATVVLVAHIAVHFIYAIILTLQNRKARGNNRYAVTSKPEQVEWASQNMFGLGVIVVLGLLLHLFNFWYNMMFAELFNDGYAYFSDQLIAAGDGYSIMEKTFGNPVFTVLYIIWFVALWFHLTHGFWSALQTLGWNGKIWFNRWRTIGMVYVTVLMLIFVVVALKFAICGGCCAA